MSVVAEQADKMKRRIKVVVALVVTLFIIVYGLIYSEVLTLESELSLRQLITFSYTCIFIFFMALLAYPTNRFLKACFLLLFGYFIPQFSAVVPRELIEIGILTESMWQNVKFDVSSYSNVLGFGSLGASGSLLANFADQSSTDKEVKVIDKTVIDNTQKVDALISKVNKLDRMLKLVIGGLIVLIFVTLFKS